MDRILVVGGGSWGTAFGHYLARFYPSVSIFIREKEIIEAIRQNGENPVFLPGVKLAKNLIPVADLAQVAGESDLVIVSVPSRFIRSVFNELSGSLNPEAAIVNLSKGFESKSLKTVSQIGTEVLGADITKRWVTLSGPSFAVEFCRDHPTAVVGASGNAVLLEKIQKKFSSAVLRIYASSDLIGVEIGGAVKNVMAIASGLVQGLGYGYNTTASLVTRATVEISRLAVKLGARAETIWGLAGIGDLMLTCFGPLSRNFQLGKRIAGGESLKDIEKSSAMIAEGIDTTRAVKQLSENLRIEMPISRAVYGVLFEGRHPSEVIPSLMKRSLKTEWNTN